MSMLELRRVSKVCGQETQRSAATVMRTQRTANEPTLGRAYSAIRRCGVHRNRSPKVVRA
jgi:hypothetical protein